MTSTEDLTTAVLSACSDPSQSWVVPFVATNWHAEPNHRTPFSRLTSELDALAGLPPLPVRVRGAQP